jgi:Ca2+-binding RTX toxin-like protein
MPLSEQPIRRTATPLATVIALVLGVAAPTAADASTARVEGGVLVYEAAPGETNDVVIAYFTAETLGGTAEYRIAEVVQMAAPQPAVTPLAGCRQHDKDPPHIAACPATDVTSVRVELGDGADRVRTLGRYEGTVGTSGCEDVLLNAGDDIPDPMRIEGGAGDDQLFEGPILFVTPGFRCVVPRERIARASSFGGPGDDLIVNATLGSGGPGADSLEAPNNPGTRQLGGPGGDVLLGGTLADRLDGGAGDDILDGGDGDDELLAGGGEDIAEGGLGDDLLSGAAGADELNGKAGADRVAGGGGPDVMEGEAGPDRLAARGGGRDGVSGGPGRDWASADRHDRLRSIERR